MEPTYRIRDFKRVFFVAQNKKMRDHTRATWTPIPINFTGRGFNALMERPDGVEIFGAFILIVEVAARCPTPGTLVSDDQPMTPTDVARITRANKATMEKAFKVLREKDIRWLELVDESSSVDCDPPQSTAVEVQDRTGQDRTGQDRSVHAHPREETPPDTFPEDGFPARLAAHFAEKSTELVGMTPNLLTATVLGITAYQAMPEDEWFRAADEFASSVNAGGLPDIGPARAFQAYVRRRFDEWTRAKARDSAFQKKNGAAPEAHNPARMSVPRI